MEIKMLRLGLYAINDITARAFSNPYVARTHEEAIRAFGNDCKNEQSASHRHPKDFELYHIGYFDQSTGEVGGLNELPIRLSRAVDFVKLES